MLGIFKRPVFSLIGFTVKPKCGIVSLKVVDNFAYSVYFGWESHSILVICFLESSIFLCAKISESKLALSQWELRVSYHWLRSDFTYFWTIQPIKIWALLSYLSISRSDFSIVFYYFICAICFAWNRDA